MRCSYRRVFTRGDWVAAAYTMGSDISTDPISKEGCCILHTDFGQHDDVPHLVVNPWTKAVYAFEE